MSKHPHRNPRNGPNSVFSQRTWPRWRKWLAIAAVAFSLTVTAMWIWLRPNGLAYTGDIEPYALARRGQLVSVREDAPPERGKGYVLTSRELVSSSGLVTRLLIRRPEPPPPSPPPLVILIGGFESGRQAIRYVSDPGEIVLVGVSYPYYGPNDLDGLDYAGALRELRLAMHDTPAALMLSLDHLFTEGGFDTQRVELVGVSLGSLFACVTGAIDERVSRVWSIHGGAGLSELFDAALDNAIRSRFLRAGLATFGNALVQRLDPEDYVGRISPRDLIAINGTKDSSIPQSAAKRLIAAANEPKELIWLETEHVHPSRKELIDELLSLVMTRLASPSP